MTGLTECKMETNSDDLQQGGQDSVGLAISAERSSVFNNHSCRKIGISKEIHKPY